MKVYLATDDFYGGEPLAVFSSLEKAQAELPLCTVTEFEIDEHCSAVSAPAPYGVATPAALNEWCGKLTEACLTPSPLLLPEGWQEVGGSEIENRKEVGRETIRKMRAAFVDGKDVIADFWSPVEAKHPMLDIPNIRPQQPPARPDNTDRIAQAIRDVSAGR